MDTMSTAEGISHQCWWNVKKQSITSCFFGVKLDYLTLLRNTRPPNHRCPCHHDKVMRPESPWQGHEARVTMTKSRGPMPYDQVGVGEARGPMIRSVWARPEALWSGRCGRCPRPYDQVGVGDARGPMIRSVWAMLEALWSGRCGRCPRPYDQVGVGRGLSPTPSCVLLAYWEMPL